jgi:hypothetical protein
VGAGTGVAAPAPSVVAAAVLLPVRAARRARSRANKLASANWVINTTATIAIRKYFFITILL